MIKYHQNGIGNEYGEDHQLTNNWNPDADYGNEYANVYFRIEPRDFGYPSYVFEKPEQREEFYRDVHSCLIPLGWQMEHNDPMELRKARENLYLHPQEFSGEVRKNDVKKIAEALQGKDTFKLEWVDLYETVYDVTDEQFSEYLKTKREDIRKMIFETSATNRRNKYKDSFDVSSFVAKRVAFRRLGKYCSYGDGKAIDLVSSVIEEMCDEGLLVKFEKNGRMYIRSLNKTEQKQKKLKIA